MSYVLINGKRYYKDDRTGKTTRDNVSEAVADQRAKRNQQMARTVNPISKTSTAANCNRKARTRSPWKFVIASIVIAMLIAAFFYSYFHNSSEEQAAENYMNVEQTQEISKGREMSYEIF